MQRQALERETSLADIQHEVVGAEQGVQISELHARASVRKSQGEAESTRLRASGEADAIRATGNAKAEAYRVGVESLGPQNYALLQLMQIIGERQVRVVPDVAVSGAPGCQWPARCADGADGKQRDVEDEADGACFLSQNSDVAQRNTPLRLLLLQ